MIEFHKVTKENGELANKCAKRAISLLPELNYLDIRMDLEAVSLDDSISLEKLSKFDDNNFMHDICGIYRHLDRCLGELKNCFLPRCSNS